MAKSKEVDEFPQMLAHLTGSEPLEKVYLFYGEDHFRIEQLVEAVVERRFGGKAPDKLTYEQYRASETPLQTVIESARNVSMFGGTKLVIYREAEKIDKRESSSDKKSASKSDLDRLLAYVKNPVKAHLVICVNVTLDSDFRKKPNMTKKAWQEIKGFVKSANCLSLGAGLWRDEEKQRAVTEYILAEAPKFQLKFAPDAAQRMAGFLGTNRAVITRYLEKLTLVPGGGTITHEIVDEFVADTRERRASELALCIYRRDSAAMLRMLGVLCEQMKIDQLVMISGAIIRTVSALLQFRLYQEQGFSDEKIASELGLQTWMDQFKNTRDGAKLYSLAELKRLHRACYETDIALKSSPIPKDLVLSRVLMKMIPSSRNDVH